MLTIRLFEERCLQLSPSEIAGSIHLCGGQEAIPVGARAALEPGDKAVATYRGHGWAIEWGVPLIDLIAEICQRAGGVNGGRAGARTSPRRNTASSARTPSSAPVFRSPRV